MWGNKLLKDAKCPPPHIHCSILSFKKKNLGWEIFIMGKQMWKEGGGGKARLGGIIQASVQVQQS